MEKENEHCHINKALSWMLHDDFPNILESFQWSCEGIWEFFKWNRQGVHSPKSLVVLVSFRGHSNIYEYDFYKPHASRTSNNLLESSFQSFETWRLWFLKHIWNKASDIFKINRSTIHSPKMLLFRLVKVQSTTSWG